MIINNLCVANSNNNDSLSTINALQSLDTIVQKIRIFDNNSLDNCSVLAICNKLVSNPSQLDIYDNAPACNREAVEDNCTLSLNRTTGNVYIDLNCNDIQDNNDVAFPHAVLRNSSSNIPLATTNVNGDYLIRLPFQTTTTYKVDEPLGFTCHPASVTITTSDTVHLYPNNNFRMCPDSSFNNLAVSLVAITPPRPGFENQYEFCLTNTGTQAIGGTLTFDYSNFPGSQYMEITDIEGGSGVQNNATVTFTFSSLAAFDQRCFIITVLMSPQTPLGIVLQPSVTVSPTGANTLENNYTDNTSTLNEVVVGSFDPNDKQVDKPILVYDPTSGVEKLIYTIRFQNSGTFSPDFIVLLDTIEEKLDIRSFEMIAASHDYTLSFPSPNVLRWRFDGIYLPGGTTEVLESHGYVTFSIATKDPLGVNEIVSNRAGIYFDYNDPIITNYAISSMTVSQFEAHQLNGLQLQVTPNPTSEFAILNYTLNEMSDGIVVITNMQGSIVQKQVISTQNIGNQSVLLSLGELPNGIYFLSLNIGKTVSTVKLVLQH